MLVLAASGLVGCGLPSLEETTEFLGEGVAECAAGERCGPAPAGSVATWDHVGIELHVTQDLVDGHERLLVTVAYVVAPVCPPISAEVAVRVDDDDLPFLQPYPAEPCPLFGWGLSRDGLAEPGPETTLLTLSDETGTIRMEHPSLRSSRQPALRTDVVAAGGELVVDLPGEGTALVEFDAFLMPSDGGDPIGPLLFAREDDGAARLWIPDDAPEEEVEIELTQVLALTGASCSPSEEEAFIPCAGMMNVRSRNALTIAEAAP